MEATTILSAGAVIKIILDYIKPLVTKKQLIPIYGLILGVAYGVATNENIMDGVLMGLSLGISAVGIHKTTKDVNKEKSIHDFNSLQDIG